MLQFPLIFSDQNYLKNSPSEFDFFPKEKVEFPYLFVLGIFIG